MSEAFNVLADASKEIAEWHMKQTEKELVTAFIAIQGEIPDPDEIGKHAEKFYQDIDGVKFEFFYWKDEHILSISQPRIPEADEGGKVKPWLQVDRVYEDKYGVADVSEYVATEETAEASEGPAEATDTAEKQSV